MGMLRRLLGKEPPPSETECSRCGVPAPEEALEGAPAAGRPIVHTISEPATVWLNLGGLSNVRETIVAGTECELVRPDRSRQRIRGSRQGASIATDHFETIGKITLAPGCKPRVVPARPFGRVTRRDRLREEHTFVVERGSPGDGLGGLWLLFGGAAAIVLGVPAAMRWRAGTLVPA